MHGEAIVYNDKQQLGVDTISAGKSCVLLGAAGTGKTTCTKGAIQALIDSGEVGVLDSEGHRYLISGTPGIIIISFTRRAVNNIRKIQSTDMQKNCITAHKLLEFQPEYYSIVDEETGKERNSMRFIPTRNKNNTLPDSIHTIIVEEASMLSIDLYNLITDALSHPVQWVFIGDIEQLPPVFGPAILGYKMLELPIIELKEVYRQALESPIIKLAHRVLSGKAIPAKQYDEWKIKDKLTIHPWKKKLSSEHALLTLAAFFKQAEENNVYDPEEDMIIIPYNKACGTIELNKHIANHLAKKRGAVTYEIKAGFNKHYLSEGDKILYDKEDAVIVEIGYNSLYTGARVQKPSPNLDYWGHNPKAAEERAAATDIDSLFEEDDIDIEAILDSVVSDSEERVTQASHKIVIKLLDDDTVIALSKSAEINAILLNYALTVHKAQGAEWRKVFLCLHNTHAKMLQRELLYTGITRAREELYCICEPESFTKGILSQKIKGNTLADKLEYFKGKTEKED